MRTRFGLLMLAASLTAGAADREFDRVVRGIEQHYGTKRSRIPLMGVASFVVKVGRPAGSSGFKIALFSDLDRSPGYGNPAELERLMNGLASGLHPLIRTRSQRNDEWTYIFTGDVGKSTKLLIATFHGREATIIQVSVNMHTLMQTVGSPALGGKAFQMKDQW